MSTLGCRNSLSASEEIPPWLREQLARFEQLQQNLQSILVQRQQVEIESSEIGKALEELKKASDTDAVYKSAGNILIRSKKDELIKDLEERKELSGTRTAVLTKQEQRVRENIKDLQAKIEEAIKSRSTASPRASS
ncbi:MAG: prefoldin subunit beta [Nitrososphaerales archaeon]